MEKVIQKGEMDLSEAVNAQAFYDIAFLAYRLNANEEMSALPRLYGFGVRTTSDIGEMALSAGCTASLCGYRQKNKWRYQAATKTSGSGARIIDALDDLREAFLLRQHTLDGLAAIPKMLPLTRRLALLGLAIDAVDDDLMDSYLHHAWLPYLTSDTVHTAGIVCEDFFAIPETVNVKRRFTENILKAGKVIGVSGKRPRFTANPDRANKITPICVPSKFKKVGVTS